MRNCRSICTTFNQAEVLSFPFKNLFISDKWVLYCEDPLYRLHQDFKWIIATKTKAKKITKIYSDTLWNVATVIRFDMNARINEILVLEKFIAYINIELHWKYNKKTLSEMKSYVWEVDNVTLRGSLGFKKKNSCYGKEIDTSRAIKWQLRCC